MDRKAHSKKSRLDREERAVHDMRVQSVKKWGPSRTEAIEATLRRTALAVLSVSSLKFYMMESPVSHTESFGSIPFDTGFELNADAW